MTTALAPDRHSKLLTDRLPAHVARYARRGSRLHVRCSCRETWRAGNLRDALTVHRLHAVATWAALDSLLGA